MLLIICKIELKFEWEKYCVLPAAGKNDANIMIMLIKLFLLSKTQNYMFLF